MQWREHLLATDVAAVRELVSNTAVFNAQEIDCAAQIITEALHSSDQHGYHFLFAEDDQARVVGYSCYGLIPLTDHSYDLYWIAVHPDYQQHGLGRQLLQGTEQALVAKGATQVFIETSSRDIYLPAQKFYAKQGYQQIMVLDDFYRAGDAKIVFRKYLIPRS